MIALTKWKPLKSEAHKYYGALQNGNASSVSATGRLTGGLGVVTSG